VSPTENDAPRIPEAALAALEQTINRLIALDPEGARRLEPMQGRVICIELSGFGTRIYLIPGPADLQLFGTYDAEPDCVMRGSPVALARMGVTDRKEDSLFSGQVQVEGDTRLAQELGDFFSALDIDWEEQLSRLTGDPIAHQVGSRVRAAGRWSRHAFDTLADDLKEYLQEEARLLPTHYEMDAFLGDVDTLRDDSERLAARLDRLRRKIGEIGGQQ
jgi:ubiquinone biosynthesis protein UbiJ